jgi:hypothetical protein
VRLDDVFHSKNPGPFAADNPASASYGGTPFVANPSYNVLNMHVGTTWNNWDFSIYALNVLNSHPVLFYMANQSIQPIGGAQTIRPLTVGATAIFRL